MKTIINFANKVKSLVDGRISNIANVEESPSTHAYAVGKQLIFNGLLCKATSAISVGDTLAVGTNLALSYNVVEQIYSLNQGLTNSLNEIADMNNVLGAKNLLPNNSESWTYGGITFTVNSDGSVTANGTASETVWLLVSDNIKLDNIAYTLTGCPEGGGAGIYEIHIRSIESDSSQWQFFIDYGNGITFTGDPNRNYVCYIAVAIGKTVSNLTFYPMLRPASIQDDTYVPYSMTNKELTDCVAKNYAFSVKFDGEKTVSEVLNELETKIENYITNNPSRLLVVLNIRSYALDMNCPVGIASYNIPGGFAFGGAMYMSNGANKIHAGSIRTSNSKLKYSIGDAVTDLTLTKPTSGNIEARCILF